MALTLKLEDGEAVQIADLAVVRVSMKRNGRYVTLTFLSDVQPIMRISDADIPHRFVTGVTGEVELTGPDPGFVKRNARKAGELRK